MSRPLSRSFVTLCAIVLAMATLACSASAAKRSKDGTRPVSANEQLAFGVDMAKRGLWREALFRFERAETLQPGGARVLNNLAVAYEAVGEFETALDYYRRALQAEPGNRDLKKNYARFVEFYQSFRPEGEDESSEDTESAEATAPAADEGT